MFLTMSNRKGSFDQFQRGLLVVMGKEIYIEVMLQPGFFLKMMVLLDLGCTPFIVRHCQANKENFTQILIWLRVHRVISYPDFAKKKKRRQRKNPVLIS